MSIWNELLPSILLLEALKPPTPQPPSGSYPRHPARVSSGPQLPAPVVTSKWSKLPTKPPKGRKPAVSGVPGGGGANHPGESTSFVKPSLTLTVTIAIGCSLLIVNVLIFAGAYKRKDRCGGGGGGGGGSGVGGTKHSTQCSEDDEDALSSEEASCSSLYQHHQHHQHQHHQQEHAVRCTCNATLLQTRGDQPAPSTVV